MSQHTRTNNFADAEEMVVKLDGENDEHRKSPAENNRER